MRKILPQPRPLKKVGGHGYALLEGGLEPGAAKAGINEHFISEVIFFY